MDLAGGRFSVGLAGHREVALHDAPMDPVQRAKEERDPGPIPKNYLSRPPRRLESLGQQWDVHTNRGWPDNLAGTLWFAIGYGGKQAARHPCLRCH
jgi:hypothetical protein